MIWRAALALAPLAMLGGCVGSLPDLTQAHGPCTGEPGGWCGFTRALAEESWEYAQLSTNTYCDDIEPFDLGGRFREVERGPDGGTCALERRAAHGDPAARAALKLAPPQDRKTYGFAYAVYDLVEGGARPKRRIIAFRGTDVRQAADWFHGNIGGAQRELGLALYREQRRKLDEAGLAAVPIVVTGHSLGGAIALQVSQDVEGVAAYVFNTSPRYDLTGPVNANRRVAISERGDIVGNLRQRQMPVRQDMLVINCAPQANTVRAHKIRNLAECLTWIAARASPRAEASRKANHVTDPPAGEAENLKWGLPPEPGTLIR
ncbi:hypothetical protein [Novosphingobium album (ex Liu et al. 2023)]|uniref:DUF2974 domain-containing protein n=1 Tax=Novosphingobium album (ex Liu et al. 2023) TaxID=3031130 RepID=A0ABT5WN54_9SPHN|nr:hypothetical protein [Novosphingobium album (ex Liu et al. 2023)]MDE8650368.1 hypothetical protein [Novosphingobium album (ex Liu et al. 2023)]